MEKIFQKPMLEFPIIAFSKNSFHIARNENEILICTKIALKNNFYKEMNIVDCTGASYNILNAKKIKGIGLFWGYNIFLNQKIKVELIYKDDCSNLNIELFKSKVLNYIKKERWDSSDNFEDIKLKINQLNNFKQIIIILSDFYYTENLAGLQ
jgi:hypothetical protein